MAVRSWLMMKLSSSVAKVVENGWKAVMRFKCYFMSISRDLGTSKLDENPFFREITSLAEAMFFTSAVGNTDQQAGFNPYIARECRSCIRLICAIRIPLKSVSSFLCRNALARSTNSDNRRSARMLQVEIKNTAHAASLYSALT